MPDPNELCVSRHEKADPLSEDKDSPVPGPTHRYPDRVLFHVSNLCSMYCRHCTRKRKVGDVDSIPDRQTMQAGIDYIRATPVIRDVLLSGGDPYLISWSTNKVVLRNYEGVISTYKEPDSYRPFFCDRECSACHLNLALDKDCNESRVVGISRLLADYKSTTTLVPEDNLRLRRRDDG